VPKIGLPTYPFQRERFWVESKRAASSPRISDGDARTETDAADWLYEIQWREMPPNVPVEAAGTNPLDVQGTWLILSHTRGLGQELRIELEKLGNKCAVARPGPAFLSEGENQFVVDPANRADFGRLFEAIGITPEKPLCGVLHMWGLDFPALNAMSAEDLAGSQLLSCGAALHLVQELAVLKTDAPPRLWLVTRGAQAMPESVGPVQASMASLWGLGRVIAAEHPEFQCHLIDLDPEETDGAEKLLAELRREASRENEIALRRGSRLAPRLVPLPKITSGTGTNVTKPSSEPVHTVSPQPSALEKRESAPRSFPRNSHFRGDKSYLVTGGTRGLGLEVARWMAREGAMNIVLMGRRDPGPDAKPCSRRLRNPA